MHDTPAPCVLQLHLFQTTTNIEINIMARTKAQLSPEELKRLYDRIQNGDDGRTAPPSSNTPSYKLEFKLSFSKTSTATFDLRYDAFLDTYLVRKKIFDTLSVCLTEQGFSFIPETLSVECVENREQFKNMIISILDKAIDKIMESSTLFECTNWSAKDDTTLTCTMFKDSYA